MSLKKYSDEKKRLLALYDDPRLAPLLPIDNISLSNFKGRKESLEADRFIVTICGEVNSGKSTIINALVFREEVLPMASSSLTAKITKIHYREKAGFIVRFYNKEEWETRKITVSEDDKQETTGGKHPSLTISSLFVGLTLKLRRITLECSCTARLRDLRS